MHGCDVPVASQQRAQVALLGLKRRVRVHLKLWEFVAQVRVVDVLERGAERSGELEQLRQHEQERRGAAGLEDHPRRVHEQRRLGEQIRVKGRARSAVKDLAGARALIKNSFTPKEFTPR